MCGRYCPKRVAYWFESFVFWVYLCILGSMYVMARRNWDRHACFGFTPMSQGNRRHLNALDSTQLHCIVSAMLQIIYKFTNKETFSLNALVMMTSLHIFTSLKFPSTSYASLQKIPSTRRSAHHTPNPSDGSRATPEQLICSHVPHR